MTRSAHAFARRLARSIGTALLALTAGATAQTFPARPVTLVIPYAPGGSTDVFGRIYAARMGELLKQPVLVDNRGGAGGLIGFRTAAQAAPDGYTLIYTTSIIATNHLLLRNPGYQIGRAHV